MLLIALLTLQKQPQNLGVPPIPSDVAVLLAQRNNLRAEPAAPVATQAPATDADLSPEDMQAAALRRELANGQASAASASLPNAPAVSMGRDNQIQASNGAASASPAAASVTQTPNEPVDLPVVPPAAHTSAANAAANPTATPNDPLEQVRYYVERINPASPQTDRLPIPTPPPIAVPRELAQARTVPTPTPSVLQRVRNIPSRLIQTPLPIVSNAAPSEGDSPAADPSLASFGGTQPKWTDPQNPLMSAVWKGEPPPVPTIAPGTPRPRATLPAEPTETPAALNRSREKKNAVIAAASTSEVAPVTSSDVDKPASKNDVASDFKEAKERHAAGATNESPSPQRVREQNVGRAEANEVKAESSPKVAAGLAAMPTRTPLFEKEIRTTGEFTVRKGRAVVTFSNVPVETVLSMSPTSATVEAAEETPISVPPEKQVKLPEEEITKPAPATREAEPSPTPQPEHAGSVVERGVEELLKSGTSSKLANRLASKVIVGSVGDEILSRDDLERHITAMETLRGIKVDEDKRPNVEGLLAQDWLERTAVAAIAQERGLSVSEEEVSAEIERRKARFGQNLPQALRAAGFPEEEVRREIRKALLVDKLVEKVMAESYPEEKLRQLYQANPDRYQPSRRLHLREIFKQKQPGREREAREAIERLRIEIAKGASFEELARRESDSPTRDENGDLGWIDASKPLTQRQVQALSNLKSGEVSDVIELADGYQLLKLVEIEEPKPGFEGAKEVVKAAVRDHIIGLAFDEALARYEVKLRNKRLTPRLPHPEVSQAKPSATPQATKAPKSSANKNTERNDRGAAASTPPERMRATPIPAPAPAATPSATSAQKHRLFPVLKKRSDSDRPQ
jgi:parvulin-like peptidyl-prolyl isomerase